MRTAGWNFTLRKKIEAGQKEQAIGLLHDLFYKENFQDYTKVVGDKNHKVLIAVADIIVGTKKQKVYANQLIGILVYQRQPIEQKNVFPLYESQLRAVKTIEHMYIKYFGVMEEFRSHGIGSGLFKALLQRERYGVRGFSLKVVAANTRAIAFYRRHGFEITAELPQCYGEEPECRDGYQMVKFVPYN